MPTKTEIRKMKKGELVDLACESFEDDGNLRKEMKALSRSDLVDLLLENDVAELPVVEEDPVPEFTPKATKGPLDLGS